MAQKQFKDVMLDLSNRYESFTAFAEDIGVSRQSLGFWINGDRQPKLSELIKIRNKLNIPIDYLVGLTDCNSLDTDVQSVTEITGLSIESVEKIMRLGDERLNRTELPDEDKMIAKRKYLDILNHIIEDNHFENIIDNMFDVCLLSAQLTNKETFKDELIALNNDNNLSGEYVEGKGMYFRIIKTIDLLPDSATRDFGYILDEIKQEYLNEVFESHGINVEQIKKNASRE